MTKVSTIGLGLAKNIFQAHGEDAAGAVIFREKLRRDQVLTFFHPASVSCGDGSLSRSALLGPRDKQPRAYRQVDRAGLCEAFVKHQKNDAADAEAICEAAQRPTMRFVAVKSEEKQVSGVIFRTRNVLVGQRTQLINAIRGHVSEFGFIAPQGPLSHPATRRAGRGSFLDSSRSRSWLPAYFTFSVTVLPRRCLRSQ